MVSKKYRTADNIFTGDQITHPSMNTKPALPFTLPDHAVLIEVALRDGFQFEDKIVPTELKYDMILRLIDAGFKHVQVASFVHPGRVPQMADAEKLMARLAGIPDVCLSALALNSRGVERACSAGVVHIEVSISASHQHSLNNTGMDADAALKMAAHAIELARNCGMRVRAGIQCAFGSGYAETISHEQITTTSLTLISAGADMLCLSDTTGMATPLTIAQTLQSIKPVAGAIPIVLHLHDTRGLGLVNVLTALSYGVVHFDTALAGMGGCPFIKNAAGNIATEDTLYLMSSLNIETGLNPTRIAECSRDLELFFGKRFPGKMYRLLCPEKDISREDV